MKTSIRRRCLVGAAAGLALPSVYAQREAAPPVLVMRHAQTTPGIGDPPSFALDRCETQRNLSDEGRAQARAFGRRLAALGWQPRAVRSSRWCRALHTGNGVIAGLGAASLVVQPWAALDSGFGNGERASAAQIAHLRERLKALHESRDGAELWVTHQVNIGALTGSNVGMAQGLWLQLRADGSVSARAFDA
jgi:phosphohistidine phosphatase SixA